MGTQILTVLQPSMLCFCLKTNSDSTWWLGCGKWLLTLLAVRGSESTNLGAAASRAGGMCWQGAQHLGALCCSPATLCMNRAGGWSKMLLCFNIDVRVEIIYRRQGGENSVYKINEGLGCLGWVRWEGAGAGDGKAEPTASSVAFPHHPAGVVKVRFIGEAQGCE